MNLPVIPELCNGEVNDFVLSLVQKELNNIPPNTFCRRRDLCEAILGCNKVVGNRDHVKDTMISVLRTWSAKQSEINTLESMGFRITQGRTHYKMRFNNSVYFSSLPTTPGDRRTGNNTAQHAISAFF